MTPEPDLRTRLEAAVAEAQHTRQLLAILTDLAVLPLDTDPAVAGERIARLLTSAVADGCAVDLVEDGRELPQRVLTHSSLRVALVAGGATVGFLTVWLDDDRPFSRADVTLVDVAARQLSSLLERRRLEARASDALATHDHFSAMASHELRTPLQALALGVQLMQRRLHASPDEVPVDWLTDRLRRAERQVERMSLLVDTLLDATELRSGTIELHRAHVDLAAVARDVVDGLREQLDWSGCPCDVRVTGATDGPWDRLRLEIIISNLVANAMKYGARQPIQVEVTGEGDEARLAVTDHGAGMAEADLPRLFQPFARLGPATYISGSGLGLWIVRKLVEAHGGRVAVASTPGAGSTFAVTLPRR